MGIALLTFVDLLGPLQSLASRWMPERRTRRAAAVDLRSDLRYVAVRPGCASRSAATGAAAKPIAARPLRVVRMVDAQHPDSRAARVVISGRMADVCAELDRLVAIEAAEGLRKPRSLH
jgi:hypothetical protein